MLEWILEIIFNYFQVLCVVADYKWTMWSYPYVDPLHYQKLSETHSRCASRLLKLAERNGGVYIKVSVKCSWFCLFSVTFLEIILLSS